MVFKVLYAVLVCSTVVTSYQQGSAGWTRPRLSRTLLRAVTESTASSSTDAATTSAVRRVVVVGGGIGGLSVAARIASSPALEACEVVVLEKNEQLGGRCGSFDVDVPRVGTFRHERGPSLLLLPHMYRAVFQECSGQDAEDYGLVMKQCSPAYQVVFEDGDRLDVGFPKQASSNVNDPLEAVSRTKMDEYEVDGAKKWDDYMQACQAFLDCGLPNFIEERLDLPSFPAFIFEALKNKARAWPLKPHSDVLDAVFDSGKMKALASFQDLYVGLEPYRNDNLFGGGIFKTTAPAVFGLLAAIELHPTNKKCGVFAPVGGFESVTKALEKLCIEKGVQFKLGTTVKQVTDDGVVACDSSSEHAIKHEFISADLIVVNADLPYAKKVLMEEERSGSAGGPKKDPSFDWDDSFSFSSGVIAFHWSIDQACDDLNTHNVFMMAENNEQAEQSWEVLRSNKGDIAGETASFNFYVHRASKTDSSAAPPGCDAIMVLVPCRTLLRDDQCAKLPRCEAIERYKKQFPDEMISKVRAAVLHRLSRIESLEGLESKILHEVVDTPATWADQFNLAAGTPFALSHGFNQLSLFRPGPRSSKKPNVLYCGASSRPGNGVPLVLIGAKQVAALAVETLENAQAVQKQ